MDLYCYIQSDNKIGPHLMSTFILIYLHIISSEINEIWQFLNDISPWVVITELIMICLEDFRILYLV